MQNQEFPQNISSPEELMTAINLAAEEKIQEITDHYGEEPELKVLLEATMHRIRTEQENFGNVHAGKMLKFGNSLDDAFEIFNQRLDTHCQDLYNAASKFEAKHEPKSGVHDVKGIRDEVKKKTKKVA